MEEGILHIELLNWLVTGDSNSEHYADGGRFHKWVECLIVVISSWALTPIEEEDDTWSWGNFLIYFSHNAMPT
jgi:hypothetical protein